MYVRDVHVRRTARQLQKEVVPGERLSNHLRYGFRITMQRNDAKIFAVIEGKRTTSGAAQDVRPLQDRVEDWGKVTR